MRSLLSARPFVPFRLHTTDGNTVEVRSPELALPGRRFVVVGLLDPETADTTFDRFTVVWYLHIARIEQLNPGSPPFSAPPGPEEATAPT